MAILCQAASLSLTVLKLRGYSRTLDCVLTDVSIIKNMLLLLPIAGFYICSIVLGCQSILMFLLSHLVKMEPPCHYSLFIPLYLDFPIHITDLQCSSFVSLSQHTNIMTYLAPITPITSSLRDLTKSHLPVHWCSVSLLQASVCSL